MFVVVTLIFRNGSQAAAAKFLGRNLSVQSWVSALVDFTDDIVGSDADLRRCATAPRPWSCPIVFAPRQVFGDPPGLLSESEHGTFDRAAGHRGCRDHNRDRVWIA